MLQFIPIETNDSHDGTISGFTAQLPRLFNNNIVNQLADVLNDKYGDVKCNVHPDCSVKIDIVCTLMDDKQVNFRTTPPCCDKFAAEITEILQGIKITD